MWGYCSSQQSFRRGGGDLRRNLDQFEAPVCFVVQILRELTILIITCIILEWGKAVNKTKVQFMKSQLSMRKSGFSKSDSFSKTGCCEGAPDPYLFLLYRSQYYET